MRDIKIAVVGAGLIGRRHIDLVHEHAALSSIVDPTDKARALADEMNVPWFSDLTECLADTPPDGAIIATPNQMHVAHGRVCVDAGVPVLIEKPIADDSETAAALVAHAADLDVAVLVGHHRRYNSLIDAAKRAVDDGSLGKLVSVQAQFWLCKPDDYFDATWRRETGAGPVFINLIHDIDLLRHLCGDIASVQAMESRLTRGFNVEDSAVILLEFANGALGTVNVSDTVVAPWSWELTSGENPAYPKTEQACYTIGGTERSLSIPDLRMWSHKGQKSWWAPIKSTTLKGSGRDPLVRQLNHFCDVISGKASPLVSGADGLDSLRVVEAIKTAAQNQARVAL